jgi:hypothetical protein
MSTERNVPRLGNPVTNERHGDTASVSIDNVNITRQTLDINTLTRLEPMGMSSIPFLVKLSVRHWS